MIESAHDDAAFTNAYCYIHHGIYKHVKASIGQKFIVIRVVKY